MNDFIQIILIPNIYKLGNNICIEVRIFVKSNQLLQKYQDIPI